MDAQMEDGNVQASKAESPASADSLHTKSDAPNGEMNDINATEGAVPSKATSKASSTRNSTPVVPTSENQPAPQGSNDATAAMDVDQQHQESKNNDSDSAQPSRKDSEDAAAAPYGTRSRNRPGRSRINYAEDTEMDFEMAAPASTNGNASDPSSRSSVAAENGQPPVVGGKKGAGAGPNSAPWGNSGPNAKDNQANLSVPGSSATTPAAQASSTAQLTTKRRKHAAKDATNGVQAVAAAPSQPAKRGAQGQVQAPAAAATPNTRESNMMTFEFSGAMLKDGRLPADDGQSVSVNGKF